MKCKSGQWMLRNGQPVPATDLIEWATWYETSGDERRVADTTVGDARVSTVFLALDHSFGGPVPVLWETFVFGGALDGEMDRYSFREDAEVGHTAMVERVKKGK